MARIFIDVSSWQNSTYGYLKQFKGFGADGIMVKITDGTNYLNPRAAAQISNGLKIFGSVAVYHYFQGNGLAEAKYFLSKVRSFGLDKSTVLGIDVEDPKLPYYNTTQINVFLRYLKSQGYTRVTTYGSGSWFNSGRIKRASLVDKHVWVAAYGVSQPGVANANAWQFSDRWHGVDASYDFDGFITGKSLAPTAQYYKSPKVGLYEVTSPVWIYKKKNFSKDTQSEQRLMKGSRMWAKAVKAGKITHLKLKYAKGYISSNADYVHRIYLKK